VKSGSSRLPGLFRLDVAERRALVEKAAGLAPGTLGSELAGGGLDLATADQMIENVVGTYALPFAIAPNFVVNDRELLVPMVVEEPSIVAAAANAAKMTREGGGFRAEIDEPLMTAQVQLVDIADPDDAAKRLEKAAPALLAEAAALSPRLCARGGGPRSLSARVLSRPGEPDGGMVVVHLDVDCRDAMGANLLNTLAETLAPRLADLARARPALRILTNLSDQRLARVTARVPRAALGDDDPALIVSASRFAELDPYRAATHNKGILNGVDAVLVATGNDWRGVEAGAHAYAATSGRYHPLAVWRLEGDVLVGSLVMPMAVGTIGGALRCHPGARLALAILGVSTAAELAGVVAAAGLATNLAALRALAHEGIQEGHMSLHRRANRPRLENTP
jgi:hydroxymethylglutaryl-CoA reductase